PRLVSDRKLIKINSYNRAIDSGSSIIGPVLAGMVFGLVSMNLFLLINGLSFILSAISELFINFDLNKSQQAKPPVGKMNIKTILQDMKEVLSFIKKNSLLSFIMPFSITFNFLITASFAVVLPYLINNVLGMTSSQYGLIEGSFSVGMLIAAIVVGKLPEKQKKRKRLVRAFFGMGLSMIIIGIPGIVVIGIPTYISFVVYIIVSIFFAFFLLSIDLPLSVVVQRSIPDFMLGRVMGVWGMITSALSPIGIILAGITLDIIPAYAIYFVSGIYLIISAVILSNSKVLREY
ncbi:MAG: MFS transporter, partial [Mobilitalea sp.]